MPSISGSTPGHGPLHESLPEVVGSVENIFQLGGNRPPGPLLNLALQLPGAPAGVADKDLERLVAADQFVEILLLGGEKHALHNLHLGQAVRSVNGHQRPRDRTTQMDWLLALAGRFANLLPQLLDRFPGRPVNH